MSKNQIYRDHVFVRAFSLQTQCLHVRNVPDIQIWVYLPISVARNDLITRQKNVDKIFVFSKIYIMYIFFMSPSLISEDFSIIFGETD